MDKPGILIKSLLLHPSDPSKPHELGFDQFLSEYVGHDPNIYPQKGLHCGYPLSSTHVNDQ